MNTIEKELARIERVLADIDKPRELLPLLQNYRRALEVVRFYGDPESYIKRSRDSWTRKNPEPGEVIPDYRHPGRDWVGTIVVGGKRARAFMQSLEKGEW